MGNSEEFVTQSNLVQTGLSRPWEIANQVCFLKYIIA